MTSPTDVGGTPYQGLDGALLYSRSQDGGQTWNPQNIILDGLTSDDLGYINTDTYSFTKRGDVIAFVMNNGVANGMIYKSEDDGDSWEVITFLETPYPTADENTLMNRYYTSDGFCDAVIDDEGKFHVAFGRTFRVNEGDGLLYGPGVDGLIYWNEDKPTLDSTIMGDVDLLEAGGYLAAWVPQDVEAGDTIQGIISANAGMTSMPQLTFNRGMLNEPIVTIVYSSYNTQYFQPQTKLNYHHIWSVTTEDGGASWSEFKDHNDNINFILSDCIYPAVSPNVVGDKIDILYQHDNLPGSAVNPPDEGHAITMNDYVYLTLAPLPVDVNVPEEVNFEVTQNMPNPAVNETYIMVMLEKSDLINLTISNLLGQEVYRAVDEGQGSGARSFRVDVSSYDSGIYFYTVKVGSKSVTKKMLVK
jgi:hypothetical protein